MSKREHWSSTFGFIMAAAGSAIGLGTLWQFPYMIGENGGGLFALVYLAATLLIGIPLFIVELVIGRRAQRGAVATFDTLAKKPTHWSFAGWLGIIASIIVLSYYTVVAGWGLNYFLMSLTGYFRGMSDAQIAHTFDLVSHSASITIFWHALFSVITAYIVYRGVQKGIEHWTSIMTPALLVLLVGLLIYSSFLGGFSQAVDYVLFPHTEELQASSILAAIGLALFTLSLAEGIMITYGSYMNKREDIVKTAMTVGTMVIVVAILVSLMIFSIVFAYDLPTASGQGLVFKTLPVLFAKMPGAMLISALFFLLFVFTALTSSVGILEAIVANWMDLFGWSRKKAVVLIAIFCFVLGLFSATSNSGELLAAWPELYGKTFFTTMVDLVAVWLLPVSGLLTALFAGYRLKRKDLRAEFSSGSKYGSLFGTWMFLVRFVVPIAILIVMADATGLISLDFIKS